MFVHIGLHLDDVIIP